MFILRAVALLSFVGLCGCSPFWSPRFDVYPFASPPAKKVENKAAEYYLVVTRDELNEKADTRFEIALNDVPPRERTIRPFARSDFEVTVRAWDPVEQKASLSVCAVGIQPVEVEMLFRERRILQVGDQKYRFVLFRKWWHDDGSLEVDQLDAIMSF